MERDPSAFESFVADLNRRRVVRVVVIYGAVIFAVLQAADIVLPALGLPDALMRLIVITTLVGLPIAVAGSWLFDITSEGIVRTAGIRGEPPPPIRLLSLGSAVVLGGVLIAGTVGWLLTGSPPETTTTGGGTVRSIAVLSFDNAGDDPDDAYFTTGFSDELRSRLSRIPQLDVAARASSIAAVTTGGEYAEVAALLGVRSLLAGSVSKDDEMVRVHVSLVSADQGEIWSAEYERVIDDLFAVQDEVSHAILDALELRLIDGERPVIDEAPTTNRMAYDKYLWGRFSANRGTEAGVRAAIDNYQMAIGFDSTYAPAWAGAAEAYAQASETLPAPEVRALLDAGTNTALEALRIGPGSSEARAAMGLFLSRSYDWVGAQAEFDRALATGPESSLILVRRALAFAGAGRHDPAVAAILTAERIDNLSSDVKLAATRILAASGRLEDAITKAQEGLIIDPDDDRILTEIGFLFLAAERFEDAGHALEHVAEVRGLPQQAMATFGTRAERFATTGQAQDLPAELSEALRDRPVELARHQLATGQLESAITTLQRAVELRVHGLATLVWLPDVDAVRGNPRFEAILLELNIEATGHGG